MSAFEEYNCSAPDEAAKTAPSLPNAATSVVGYLDSRAPDDDEPDLRGASGHVAVEVPVPKYVRGRSQAIATAMRITVGAADSGAVPRKRTRTLDLEETPMHHRHGISRVA